MTEKLAKALFIAAGLYDGLLGIVFFSFSSEIFDFYGVTPPNHVAYIQFPALLLLVFAIMFFRIANEPIKNRELILYGSGLKLSYFGLAFWHDVTVGIPSMWMPWAWGDLVWFILFLAAWLRLGRMTAKAETS
ncbi:MAG: hypothetical protein AB2807_09255 [Candidatus Sedimenticola endophacoides]